MELKIELSGLKFYACHGVSSQERQVGNHFAVDIAYTFAAEMAIASDELHDTVNYADVYGIVKAEMERPSRLLEHVAGRIFHALHVAFPQFTRLRVKLSKLNPPLGGEVHGASVTVEDSWNREG
ncbi:MAG: dihydroneopterin aldolase [Tannerella sp.]|jgi:dihydroneopterin aldolase|nr:dihydroneopterin aldolase [Tannerella sp.]